ENIPVISPFRKTGELLIKTLTRQRRRTFFYELELSERKMPLNNNNQKAQSAAARFVELPLVRSACNTLSVLYSDTKHSHTHLRAVCEVLENSVTALGSAACDTASPVIVKLEPKVSCGHGQNKVHEVQDVVNIAVNGTMDCVQCTVAWLVEVMQQVHGTDQTLVERALSVAAVGLDSALNMSEALMDSVLPPTEQDERHEAAAHPVNGFEAPAFRRSFPVRLVSLSAQLCRRSYKRAGAKIHSVQVMQTLSRSTALVQDLQRTRLTMTRNIQRLPQYLQQQAVSVLFYISLMYNLCSPLSEQNQPSQVTRHFNGNRPVDVAAEVSSPQQDIVQGHPQATPPCRPRRPIKILAYSEASSLFFWVRCLLRAIRRRLCCSTRGVTSLWILGALVLGFLPVNEKADVVQWCRLKSLRILLALLGPRRRGTVLSVSPGMSFSPESSQNAEVGINDATTHRLAFALACPAGTVAGVSLAEQQAHTAMGQHTLLHGEALLVVASADAH
ncbi:hypothetical protein INR49_014372, partial [Caranx melampygus]